MTKLRIADFLTNSRLNIFERTRETETRNPSDGGSICGLIFAIYHKNKKISGASQSISPGGIQIPKGLGKFGKKISYEHVGALRKRVRSSPLDMF